MFPILFAFLAVSVDEWLQIVTGVGGFMVVTGIPVGLKLWKTAKDKGFAAAAAEVPGVLIENRKALIDLYGQFRSVVGAADQKDVAIAKVFAAMPPQMQTQLKDILAKTADGTILGVAALDIVRLPFADLVNQNLIKNGTTNDDLLKALVTSAKKEESANVTIDRVASTIGGVAGTGLNIAGKIATGGALSPSDVVGALVSVGASALGAKDSSTPS